MSTYTTTLGDILKALGDDTTTGAYIVREGFEGIDSSEDHETGLIQVTPDPSGVVEDDDYQGPGCVRVRYRFLFRVKKGDPDINTARRAVIDISDAVKNALQTDSESAHSDYVRIQSPKFTKLVLQSTKSQELDADYNVVVGQFGLVCLAYETPGSR